MARKHKAYVKRDPKKSEDIDNGLDNSDVRYTKHVVPNQASKRALIDDALGKMLEKSDLDVSDTATGLYLDKTKTERHRGETIDADKTMDTQPKFRRSRRSKAMSKPKSKTWSPPVVQKQVAPIIIPTPEPELQVSPPPVVMEVAAIAPIVLVEPEPQVSARLPSSVASTARISTFTEYSIDSTKSSARETRPATPEPEVIPEQAVEEPPPIVKEPTPPPTPPPVIVVVEKPPLTTAPTRVEESQVIVDDIEVENPMAFSDNIVVQPLKGLFLFSPKNTDQQDFYFADDEVEDFFSNNIQDLSVNTELSSLYDIDNVYPKDTKDLPFVVQTDFIDWGKAMASKEKVWFPTEKRKSALNNEIRAMLEAKRYAYEQQKGKKKEKEIKSVPAATARSEEQWHVGDLVDARLGGKQQYVRGVISEVLDEESFKIHYLNGIHEDYVPIHFIRHPEMDDVSMEKLESKFHPGNKVLARQSGNTEYVPGTIKSVFSHGGVNFYQVYYNNGVIENKVNETLVEAAGCLSSLMIRVGDAVEAYVGGDFAFVDAVIVEVTPEASTVDLRLVETDERRNGIPIECLRVNEEKLKQQSKKSKFQLKEVVEFRCATWKGYSKGIIASVNGDSTYNIETVEGTIIEDIPSHFIARFGSVLNSERKFEKDQNERKENMEVGLLQVLNLPFEEHVDGRTESGGSTQYFSFVASDPQAMFAIELDVLSGQPDLFVSTTGPPSAVDYTWSSISAFGENKVLIEAKDKDYIPYGPYYIAVTSHDESEFQILVKEITFDARDTGPIKIVEAATERFNILASAGKMTRDGIPLIVRQRSQDDLDKKIHVNFPGWTKIEADQEDAAYDELLRQLQNREITVKKFFDPKLISAMKLHMRSAGLDVDNLTETQWSKELREDVKSAVTIWGPDALRYILATEIKTKEAENANKGEADIPKPSSAGEKRRGKFVYKYRNPPKYVPAWHNVLRVPTPPSYAISHTDRAHTPDGIQFLTQKTKPLEGLKVSDLVPKEKEVKQLTKLSYFADLRKVKLATKEP